jgi:hypothetical protein
MFAEEGASRVNDCNAIGGWAGDICTQGAGRVRTPGLFEHSV